MSLEVYDYRKDVRNVVITPEIRSRFMRVEPGQVAPGHTHDLGHEVFLVLEGEAEFEIDGEKAVVGPGQMVFARVDQNHVVTCLGDKPMTMYLSVTPHIEPTHTRWDESGQKLPPRYGGASAKERAANPDPTPNAELLERHVAATGELAEAARRSAAEQEAAVAALRQALESGDAAAAKAAVDAMAQRIYEVGRAFYQMGAIWNELAARGGGLTP
jgi:quercetin dioxygenase-like cupin family protein